VRQDTDFHANSTCEITSICQFKKYKKEDIQKAYENEDTFNSYMTLLINGISSVEMAVCG
jgi:hypothetical protein